MYIKQLSVFVENKAGRLAEITNILAENNINILALSIADTTDFGILRLIVKDPEKAAEILRKNNVMVKMTETIAISVSHTPGSLASVLKDLVKVGAQIEYMYDFANKSSDPDTMIILRLTNQEEALKALKETGVKVLDSSAIIDN